MGLWQTGREGVWSLAERVGSQAGGSGGVRRHPGLDGREKQGKKRLKMGRSSKTY